MSELTNFEKIRTDQFNNISNQSGKAKLKI